MRFIAGDCRDVLATLDPDSLDACVITDPLSPDPGAGYR